MDLLLRNRAESVRGLSLIRLIITSYRSIALECIAGDWNSKMGMKEVMVTVVIYLLGAFYATLSLIAALWDWAKYSFSFWGYRSRPVPPLCLSNPELGTHGYARLKDLSLHYVAKGDQNNPLMLCLHGFPEFWYSWRHQLLEFSNQYWVVAVDLRGYGESDKPEDKHAYHMNNLVDDICQLIPALGKEKCGVLMAHDWGGALGWRFVSEHPELVEKFIAFNCPHPSAFLSTIRSSLKQFRMSWYMFLFQLPWFPEALFRICDMAVLDESFRGRDKKKSRITDEDIEAYKFNFSKPGSLTPPINYYRCIDFAGGGKEKWMKKKIKTPSMLVFGTGDVAISTETADATSRYVEGLKMVKLPGVSHWVQQEAPDQMGMKEVMVTAVIYLLGAFYATLSLISALWDWAKYSFSFWGYRSRPVPPLCLSNPELGTHGYARLKDLSLHYVAKGDQNNPLMLCLHGFPEFWYSWRHQLLEFSNQVVAVDLRGYGESDKPEDKHAYHMNNLVDDIRQLIPALGAYSNKLMGMKEVMVTAVIYLLGAFYATLSLISALWDWAKYSFSFWGYRSRPVPPLCLSNPELGTHGYARLKDLSLHYVAKGDQNNPLMLCLHGFPEFWYSWRHQLLEFSNQYWVVAVDLRGYGESDKPEDKHAYHMNNLVDDIRQLIPALGKEKCGVLMAHDWGGALGWRFVSEHPELVEKFIAFNCIHPSAFHSTIRSSFKQFRMSWYKFLFQLPWLPEALFRINDMAILDEAFRGRDKKKSRITDEDIEAYKYNFSKPGSMTPPINFYRCIDFAGGGKEKWMKKKIKTPSMLVFGTGDVALSTETADATSRYVEGLKMVKLPGVSHWVQQEAPDQVNKLIWDFLNN
ncbi:unnamed protein product [Darwinula stevensoni]|uniref:AB hydrolase-1 domain-containing protein n=1 Tax=Darwinula stevensoni TaxID=69355 RepID=A0A7R8XFY4_9CRUS|nr:unnamed protein product [Darwinula stevensoni]CAG0895505.1 unnamed protein product [Darwinula stevensoni]